jgi:hypothetical protein
MALVFFNDLQYAPQKEIDLENHIRGRTGRPPGDKAARAITYLVQAGYLKNVAATVSDDPLYMITANGIRQAERDVAPADLDPAIWGDVRI